MGLRCKPCMEGGRKAQNKFARIGAVRFFPDALAVSTVIINCVMERLPQCGHAFPFIPDNRMVETLFERKTGSDAKPSLFFQCLPQGVARIVVKHCFGCAGQKKPPIDFLIAGSLCPKNGDTFRWTETSNSDEDFRLPVRTKPANVVHYKHTKPPE